MRTLHKLKQEISRPKLSPTQELTLKYILYQYGEAVVGTYNNRTRIYRNTFRFPYSPVEYHRWYAGYTLGFTIDWSKVTILTR